MFETRGKILNKGAKFFFASTHGTKTLVDFYTYVELNKDIIVDVVGIYFC
jgi:hypothetical protein